MVRKETRRARRSGRKGTRRQRGGVLEGVRKAFRKLCYGDKCPNNNNNTNNNKPAPSRGRNAGPSSRRRSGSPHNKKEEEEEKELAQQRILHGMKEAGRAANAAAKEQQELVNKTKRAYEKKLRNNGAYNTYLEALGKGRSIAEKALGPVPPKDQNWSQHVRKPGYY